MMKNASCILRAIAIGSIILCGISGVAASELKTELNKTRQHKLKPDAFGWTAAKEEMVAGFIVKPHPSKGKKHSVALKSHDATGLSGAANMPLRVARAMSNGAHVLKMDKAVPLSEAKAIAERMMRDGDLELVEPDHIMYPTTVTPNDPGYGSYQWHYMAPSGSNKGGANLPNAWGMTLGSQDVTVAVLDTGYRAHKDLDPLKILPGYDFITSTAVSNDGNGRDADATDPGDWAASDECFRGSPASNSTWHGTHVLGTIAAAMNNGEGGTGIAPKINILPVRVLGKCGGHTSDIVDAMRWAAGLDVPGVPKNPNPAKVLNLSLGGSGTCSNAFQSAVTDVLNAKKLVVVASGNNSSTRVGQPANCIGAIAVTAHAVDGDNASYANIGPEVFISAPGGGCGTQSYAAGTCTHLDSPNGRGVYSLGNTGLKGPGSDRYASLMGTSMATPHVSGVIALMLTKNPTLTPDQVKAHLGATARPYSKESSCSVNGYADKLGKGLLDAELALKSVDAGAEFPTVTLNNMRQVVAPGTLVNLSGSATAPSGYTIQSYGWSAAACNPTAVTLETASGNPTKVSFTAPATGTYSFVLTATATNGVKTITGTATAIVRVNTAPSLSIASPKTVAAGEQLVFQVGAVDVDDDEPIYHAISLPPGASLNADGTFLWSSATPAGTYTVNYYATDEFLASDPGSIQITVTKPPSSSGGGSMDSKTLLALAGVACAMRFHRRYRARGTRPLR